MTRLFVGLFVFLGYFASYAQSNINWTTLSDVTYSQEYVAEVDGYFQIPEFGDSVKALNGKEVIITGYVLAIDKRKSLYMLSKNPMASCFFCGGSGPETIMEIQFADKNTYETDEVVTIKGILRLNKDDINHTNYILTEAVGF